MVERRGLVAEKCLDAGKHVYLDKPLAGSVKDLDTIVAAAERNDVRAQMFTMNLAGWVQEARRAVAEGRIGELKAIHAENVFSKGRAGSVPKGAVRRESEATDRFTHLEAKREMFDVGIYGLGFIHAVTGLEIESVYAHTGNYFFAEHLGAGVEDFGAMAMRLEGGVTATLVAGRFGWMSHPQSGPQKIVVAGTEGTMTFDAFRPRIELYNNEPDFVQPAVDPYDPMGMWGASHPAYSAMPKRRWVTMPAPNTMGLDVAAFIDCIEAGREPEVSPRVAASLTEVILGAYVSAARGEEVQLPLPRG
jgi:predicted dehydrogenase